MRYLTFGKEEKSSYGICILTSKLNAIEIDRYYISPNLVQEQENIIAYTLHKENKRTPVKAQKEYLDDLLPMLEELGVKYLLVADGEYFKTLAKVTKIDPSCGYVLDCAYKKYDFKVIYVPSTGSLFYDPEKVTKKIDQGTKALRSFRAGTYREPGKDIIKFAAYPKTAAEIKVWLIKLLEMDCDLTADIEGYGLKHYDSGIGTISFCWNKHEGIAFPIDYGGDDPELIRSYLKEFFIAFKRKMIWHNISFDVYILVYQLFMDGMLDTAGLLTGLEVMLKNWECTKLISYLATNSCAGNKLGLKDQAQEFAGNYAVEDIKDITKIPLEELLEYNLVDSMSTWFVFEKHHKTMVADQQLDIYEVLFKEAIVDIIQMQLTGLPISREKVLALQVVMQSDSDKAVSSMLKNQYIAALVDEMNQQWVAKRNRKLKTKIEVIENAKEAFNPNSAIQLQRLLFGKEFMNLPVLEYTDTKAEATGKDVLEKLINHTKDQSIIDFLNQLIDYKNVDKILTAFIPAFLKAPMCEDGWYYVFGNFNLGGTKSGRLSSNNPNMQNLPASSKWAKQIKMCFIAPNGWLLVGLDFSSLEDRISALTTNDPMKLKVYTDGYDGHCLRAYAYFTDKMPDIDPNSISSINSISKKYKDLRGKSKAPTFALTYGGTYATLIKNCGFTEILAKEIEKSYHEMYSVSDEWVADKITQAAIDGYVTVAFGLRLRTPLLEQVILGNSSTPYEAAAEGRTAGNALGQSWGLLNTRAGSEFMKGVRKSKFRLSIKPCAHIHDAQYFLIKDDIDHIMYLNEHLVNAVKWQDNPEIYHDQVKLGGELSIFNPSWNEELEIPNNATEDEVLTLCRNHRKI
ncbi:MAG: hypothetical protein COA63_014210 [Methylophaga sp.]|nr:hypothetical protein [Methylophaga sp.]